MSHLNRNPDTAVSAASRERLERAIIRAEMAAEIMEAARDELNAAAAAVMAEQGSALASADAGTAVA
jgi:hypothetical protein